MNAETSASEKTNKIRYKKVGKKYVQDNDPWAYTGLHEGWWLIKVAPNSTSIRAQVYPARAELTAAAREKEDQLVDIIRQASLAKPKAQGITMSAEAHKDWTQFVRKHGDEFSSLNYPSFQENAEKIVEALLTQG
jgi:hypothetical protein